MGDSSNSEQHPQERVLLAHISIAAQRLGLSRYQIQDLIDEGRLPAEKIGRRTYVRVVDLDEFIEAFGKSA